MHLRLATIVNCNYIVYFIISVDNSRTQVPVSVVLDATIL